MQYFYEIFFKYKGVAGGNPLILNQTKRAGPKPALFLIENPFYFAHGFCFLDLQRPGKI
ncbi:hypothetical protein BA6E_11017 [Bacteroidales bacterium 6E]|nr:hypothetical protein BA6E_11017 [Bacteroidales bacterium 6E]